MSHGVFPVVLNRLGKGGRKIAAVFGFAPEECHAAVVTVADAVRGLLSDPELRSRLGSRARTTAIERFAWEAIAEEAYRSYLVTCRALSSTISRNTCLSST